MLDLLHPQSFTEYTDRKNKKKLYHSSHYVSDLKQTVFRMSVHCSYGLFN